MKTQGLMVVDGYLVLVPFLAIPVQFWNRLRHELTKRGLHDEFVAEYRFERHMVQRRREESFGWDGREADWVREEDLFRRWVERIGMAGPLWPWERGWTEEMVDAYLVAPAARAA